MPRFSTTALKRNYTNSLSYYRQKREEIIAEGNMTRPHFDIFMSHSFLDQETILGLFVNLSRRGYKVYVDWIIDAHMDRTSVSKKTADIIKKRMSQSDTLFHATSMNAKKSNWMPWETGYMDGIKDKCAIVEVLDEGTSTFQSREFLLLYPFVTDEVGDRRSVLCINNRDTRNKIPFEAWKNGKKP